MSLKRALFPAVAGLVLMLGCESKPTDPIPVQAPGPVVAGKEEAILNHLRYMSVRKDLKHASTLSLANFDTKAMYGNIHWFHKHAGDIKAPLTAEEITAFGLEDLKNMGLLAPGICQKDLADAKDKVALKTLPALPTEMVGLDLTRLDLFPNQGDKNRQVELEVVMSKIGPVADAGLYRLARAVPDEVWRKMTVQAVKPNAGDKTWKDVFLQIGTRLVVQVTVAPKKDGNLGVIYMYFKLPVGSMKKVADHLAKGGDAAEIK